MQVFAHDGDCGFTGRWSTITSARGFDSLLVDIPQEATHFIRYTSGGTTAIAKDNRIFGTTADLTVTTGTSVSGSPIVTNIANTTSFRVGGYVCCDTGFASTTVFMCILSKTDTTITLDTNSNSSVTGTITIKQYPDAIVVGVVLENGSVAGGDAEGVYFLRQVNGTFTAGALTNGAQNTDYATFAEGPLAVVPRTRPKAALITVEDFGLNFTLDGTIPTVTAGTNAGHTMAAGTSYVVRGYSNIKKFQCINAVNASGAIAKYSLFY